MGDETFRTPRHFAPVPYSVLEESIRGILAPVPYSVREESMARVSEQSKKTRTAGHEARKATAASSGTTSSTLDNPAFDDDSEDDDVPSSLIETTETILNLFIHY